MQGAVIHFTPVTTVTTRTEQKGRYQKELSGAIAGLVDKVNNLVIANTATTDRRVGYPEGFGLEDGVASSFEGLLYLYIMVYFLPVEVHHFDFQ